ncbi:glycosyltransferase [Chitinophaga qingshengii]|uniref:Glycosyltransferase family 1 protein n=1 Tax=Chitinophaga qingshengii TaxID=1569794 RepID=A0ABR7TH70_9BACT|nr:glycosyltransferase [Chitinophaga qingshengii]MBC9929283.1 glycosyltransferase family 1 protein [Chitinophaga qingshengii]
MAATILFLPDLDEGHIFPTIGLAQRLEDHGYEVIYLTIEDNKAYLDEYGFESEVVFREIYPYGWRFSTSYGGEVNDSIACLHLLPLLQGELDEIIQRRCPDLLIISFFLPVEALLLHYKYRLPQIMITSFLREPFKSPFNNCLETVMKIAASSPGVLDEMITGLLSTGVEANSLQELAAPLQQIPELITCPEILDFPGMEFPGNVFHIEPSVRQVTLSRQRLRVPAGKKIILASFGSQVSMYRQMNELFIARMLEVMKLPEAEEWHLFLGIGREADPAQCAAGVTDNVTILNWLPMPELLEHSALALIHGGLGAIKECISFRVPMVIFPITAEQVLNSERIIFHRLGASGRIDMLKAPEIAHLMTDILMNEDIREQLDSMSREFRRREEAGAGVEIITRLINNSIA